MSCHSIDQAVTCFLLSCRVSTAYARIKAKTSTPQLIASVRGEHAESKRPNQDMWLVIVHAVRTPKVIGKRTAQDPRRGEGGGEGGWTSRHPLPCQLQNTIKRLLSASLHDVRSDLWHHLPRQAWFFWPASRFRCCQWCCAGPGQKPSCQPHQQPPPPHQSHLQAGRQ